MRKIQLELLQGDGAALVTVEDLVDLAEMRIADFRDSSALSHKPTGRFVGLSTDGRIVLCRGPLWMEGGIWRGTIGEEATRNMEGAPISSGSLSLSIVR